MNLLSTTDRTDYQYDLFISCTGMDHDWVDGFLVRELGLPDDRIITKEKFKLGHSVIGEFERAVKCSRYTVLVLSPAYLSDEWTTFGEQLASHASVAEQRDRLIPLLKEQCELPLRIDFRVRLNCTDEAGWKSETIRLRDLLALPEPKPERIPCPYPGMIPFNENDEEHFFGRDEEIDEFLRRLRLHRFLTVIGPSGSGKSSLVFAGLIPKLKVSSLFGSGQWCIRSFRPGANPLANLQAVLGGDITALEMSIQQFLSTQPDVRRFLLIVDQFEELFTQGNIEATLFQQTILKLLEIPNVYLILTIRADFYPDLMESLLWDKIRSHRFEIVPLDEKKLKQAIVRPAEVENVYIDSALVDRLLVDAKGEPGVLPLIQETLVLLWEKLQRRFLPLKAYEGTGLQAAISLRANTALADLETEAKQAIARRIFLHLIQFGEGRPDTRRQQLEKNLQSEGDDLNIFRQTLEYLATHRLLTFTGEKDSKHRKVDIAHEALITGWPTLQEWIKERQEEEQIRRRLDAKVQEWIRLGQQDGGLLDEVELTETERWLSSSDAKELGVPQKLPALVEKSRNAIEVAKKEKEAASQREIEQQKALTEEQQKRAEEAERSLLRATALALATQAEQLASGRIEQNDLSAILALQAFIFNQRSEGYAIDRVDRALRSTLNLPHFGPILHFTELCESMVFSPDGKILASGHVDGTIRIWEVGQFIPVVGLLQNQGITPTILLKSKEGEEVRWSGFPSRSDDPDKMSIVQLAFTSDNRLLASLSNNGVIRVWCLNGLQSNLIAVRIASEFMSTQGYPYYPRQVSPIIFHPDDKTLILGGHDGIYLWDLNKPSSDLVKINNSCDSAAFAVYPNSRTLVSLPRSRSFVALYDLEKPGLPCTTLELGLPGHGQDREISRIPTFALSLDGFRAASCSHYRSSSNSITFWDWSIRTSDPIDRIGLRYATNCNNTSGGPDKLAFSFDGQSLASGNPGTGCIHVWKLSQFQKRNLVLGGDEMSSIVFNPDGHLLASGGKSIRLFQLKQINNDSIIITRHQQAVRSVAFSPNGQFLLSCGLDNAIHILDLHRSITNPFILDVSEWDVRLCFSDFVALSDERRNSWDTEEAEQRNRPYPLAFSSDSQKLAVVVTDEDERQCIMILQLNNLAEDPLILRGPLITSPHGSFSSNIRCADFLTLKFDNNSQTLISLDFNREIGFGTIRRWSLLEPDAESVIEREIHSMEPVAMFSDDGQSLLAGGTGFAGSGPNKGAFGVAKLWDLQQPEQESIIFSGSEGAAVSIAFDQNNQMLATGNDTGLITVWENNQTDIDSEPRILQSYQDIICSLAFSPVDHMLASGGDDQSIKLWDLSLPRNNPIVLQGHQGRITSVAFSPDGKFLASGSEDRTMRIWIAQTTTLANLIRQKIKRNLTESEWIQFVGRDIKYECTHTDQPPGIQLPPLSSWKFYFPE